MNQGWNIFNWTLENQFQWQLIRNQHIFIQDYAFENVVCKMASISSRPQWVKMYTCDQWLKFGKLAILFLFPNTYQIIHIRFLIISVCFLMIWYWWILLLSSRIISLAPEQFTMVAPQALDHMMTSSNGNIFCVTGHLCGVFTGHRWIPRTKATDGELWCFLRSVPRQTVG